jgi:hypothetical protein
MQKPIGGRSVRAISEVKSKLKKQKPSTKLIDNAYHKNNKKEKEIMLFSEL